MSADRLREAADFLRRPIPNSVDLALADWLDEEADFRDRISPDDRLLPIGGADQVADAILGGGSDDA